jgi:hypothetical protein
MRVHGSNHLLAGVRVQSIGNSRLQKSAAGNVSLCLTGVKHSASRKDAWKPGGRNLTVLFGFGLHTVRLCCYFALMRAERVAEFAGRVRVDSSLTRRQHSEDRFIPGDFGVWASAARTVLQAFRTDPRYAIL